MSYLRLSADKKILYNKVYTLKGSACDLILHSKHALRK